MARDNQYENDQNTDLPVSNVSAPTGNDLPATNIVSNDDVSLESILAEYKGTAYIAGDKRTPASVLQEKTEKIVKEAAVGSFEQPTQTADVPDSKRESSVPDLDAVNKAKRQEYCAEKENKRDTVKQYNAPDNNDIITFDQYHGGSEEDSNRFVDEISKAIESRTLFEAETQKSARKVFGLFSRNAEDVDKNTFDDDVEREIEPLEPAIEDVVFEEPDYRAATKRFAEKCNVYSKRSFVSLLLSIVMAVLTLVFRAGVELPFGIGQSNVVYTGVLLIFLFLVMMLSVERLIDGFTDMFKGRQGIDTLNLFSCLATSAAAVYSMLTADTAAGLPYCVVSAFSLTFTLWGEKVYYKALTETMKTAQTTATPSGVIAELLEDLDRTIVKRVPGRTSGFYNSLVQTDITETTFKYAAPILITASLVLSLYSSVSQGQGEYFLRYFAAIMAAAAPFSAIFAFSVPFNAIAKRTKQSGATVAGWGGADELFHTDGASITDEDLFPEGTISLSGVKIFDEVSPEKAIRYTGSLIIASNSGLAKLFTEQIYKQGLTKLPVEEFSCYEGGIGGSIRGDNVIAGSAAFMNLMGIRIPGSLNMKNAVFAAIEKKLIAVFSVNYVPVKSVQNALISVLRYHVKLFFAVRDFNITPVMLEQKFKVPVDDVEYIAIQNTYDISDERKQEAKRVPAILTRSGMGPYVEAITGGRRLRSTALLATVLTLLSAVGGMLIMYAISWTGAFAAASAGNLLLYMISMLCIVLIVCGFAKFRH